MIAVQTDVLSGIIRADLLLEPDAGGAGDTAPARHFRRNHRSELLRTRARRYFNDGCRKTVHDVPLLQYAKERTMQLREHRRGCIRCRNEYVPVGHDVIVDAGFE